MSLSLALARLAVGMTLTALLINSLAHRARRPFRLGRRMTMALATLALGLALFALFYGLVAACDRL